MLVQLVRLALAAVLGRRVGGGEASVGTNLGANGVSGGAGVKQRIEVTVVVERL